MLLKDVYKPGWTEQFWSKVAKKSANRVCWEWIGARYNRGYGFFKGRVKYNDRLITVDAHRYSYLLHYNEIPDGMLVCHHCDNPGCVNPKHLYLGDVRKNTQDACDRGLIGHAKGSRHGRSKLTEEQVEWVYQQFYQADLSKSEIAKTLEVTSTQISDILRGRRWKHMHSELTSKYAP